MERLPLPESPVLRLTPDHGERLLDITEEAIRARFEGKRHRGPDVDRLPEPLRRPCGAFVTVRVEGRLNGCVGDVDTDLPLGSCVARLAVAAAFEDPRLPALRREQWDRTELDISLLSPRTGVPAHTRAQLLQQLAPSRHGLIISARERRALFLPIMWEQLPDPEDFVDHLFEKAGLPESPWPADLQAEVFTTESFTRHLSGMTTARP